MRAADSAQSNSFGMAVVERDAIIDRRRVV